MYRKKIISLILLCFYCLFFQATSLASEVKSEKKIIKVGYEPGYGILDDIGSIDAKGFGYELLRKMESYTDYEFVFIGDNFDAGMKALANGEIDVFGPVSFTEERANLYSYTKEEFLREQVLLAAPRDDKDFYYNDPEGIDGSFISAYSDVTMNDELMKYAKKHDIDIKFLFSVDPDTYYYRKDANLYLVSSLNTFLNYQTVLNLGLSKLYLITAKDNPELAQELDKALLEVMIHDTGFVSKLYLKYYGDSVLNQRSLSKKEILALNDHVIKVGYINNEPMQYENSEKQVKGVAPEVIQILADEYKFSVEFVDHELFTVADHKKCDVLLFGSYFLDEEYTPTQTYGELSMMLVGASNALKKPEKVGIVSSFTLTREILLRQFPQSALVFYYKTDDLIQGYRDGEIDTMFLTEVESYYALNKLLTYDLFLQTTNIVMPLRMYISNESAKDFVSAFESMLARVSPRLINDIVVAKSADTFQKYSFSDFMLEYRLEIIIAILLFSFVFLLFIILFQLKKRKEILYIVNHDDVTNLISIQAFRYSAAKILAQAQANEYEIITVDIDYFRLINNTFGYEVGTQVINAAAQILTEAYDEKDALVSRVTGDLFVILRKTNSDTDIDRECALRLDKKVRKIVGKGYHITLSAGKYVIEDANDAINILIDRANIARTRGKSLHKDTFITFNEEMKKEYETRNDIVLNMEKALLNEEFYIVYQPKINLKTMKIDGAEALVRWKTSEGKLIFPNDFIPVFEANGFTTDLDLYVFDKVCKFIAENKDKMSMPKISVNLSGKSVGIANIEKTLKAIVDEYQLTTNMLEIEVTESALIGQSDMFIEKIKTFRELGFNVSMDDFGAGSSSLNRLYSIDVDVLKLDKVFLDNNISNIKGNIIVQNVINMAKELNMKVVSEGVESKEQGIWLQGLECDLAQGYYFDKPLEVEVFKDYLLHEKKYTLDCE